MKLLPSLSFATRVILLGALTVPTVMVTPARAQAGATLDQIDFDNAQKAVDANKLEEAAGLYEGIPVKYPTSPIIPAAAVRLGYVYFRLQQYDKAVKTLEAAALIKNIPPEMAELALGLAPQVRSAKAAAEGAKSPQRKKLFEDAIKGYDAFLAKYPQSAEVEASNYGKAVSYYQIEGYDDAMKALRANLTNPVIRGSESIFDSQFLMALTMGTVASNAAQQETKPWPEVEKEFKNAELMLNDIVTKGTDVALANESRFQIGEMNYARAGFTKDAEAKKALFQRALDIYRVVQGKDVVVAAQKARIERYKVGRVNARQSRDPNLIKRFDRYIEREQEKLATIEARPDPTLVARVKSAQVFFQQDRPDECRVILNYVKPLLEDEDQKKTVAYYYTLSLARQNADSKGQVAQLSDRTEAAYKEFTGTYSNDPIGENLPLIVGAAYTETNPTKAGEYFEELKKNFPKSKLLETAASLGVSAKIKEAEDGHPELFEEALKIADAALKGNPTKDVAAAMKFAKATVYQKQKRPQDAAPIFKDVRDNYPGTEQATQAEFFYPQLMLEAGDAKGALPELKKFVQSHPKSPLLATALFFTAQAEVATDKKDDAMKTYERLAEEFPQSEVAPFSYFQRAQILMGREKQPEVITLMQTFMGKYPDAPTLFQAYDFVAQIQVQVGAQAKTDKGEPDPVTRDAKKEEAIGTYEEFAEKKPKDPMAAQALYKAATHWKELTEGMGRYIALPEGERPKWQKRLDGSIKDGERVVREFPETPQVALALALLLDDQKLIVGAQPTPEAKKKAESDIEGYFQKFADEFKDKPATRSKIIFTLAGSLVEKDKKRAQELMDGVYDATLKYAPEDMDLYGSGLIDQKKYDAAEKVFTKLGKDYAIPAGKEPQDAPRDIQEAQSMMLFGLGNILQEQKKVAEAKVRFDELEKLYPWSPKMLAANLGIAEAFYKEKKYEEALERLGRVVKAGKAPPELRAKAMFLLSQIHEDNGRYDDAINNYVKISAMYASVPKVAAEGLYRGAMLLEKQAKGELPLPTPVPKATPQKKAAPGAKPGSTPEAPAEPAESKTAAK